MLKNYELLENGIIKQIKINKIKYDEDYVKKYDNYDNNIEKINRFEREINKNKDYNKLIHDYKYRRYHLAQFPCATWIYDRNEICFYVKYMLERLVHFYLRGNVNP